MPSLSNSKIKIYSDTNMASTIEFATGDIDFGVPYYKKKIYKVIVYYTLGADLVNTGFSYKLDSAASYTSMDTAIIDGTEYTYLKSASTLQKAELLFGYHLKCNTFALKFQYASSIDIVIDKIEIIYSVMQKDSDE